MMAGCTGCGRFLDPRRVGNGYPPPAVVPCAGTGWRGLAGAQRRPGAGPGRVGVERWGVGTPARRDPERRLVIGMGWILVALGCEKACLSKKSACEANSFHLCSKTVLRGPKKTP
jgi:hypothetical protein